MHLRPIALLCFTLWSLPALAQEATPPANNAAPPEQVLVVGQRPGPGLWKVSKDDHVLWVFGTYSPLPVRMLWRSQEAETIIAQSQELLTAPGLHLSVGWKDSFNIVTALPSLIGVRNNANGAHLQDVVPAADYARWSVLKAKYLGADNAVESLRPMFAAEELFQKAISHAGMGSDAAVSKRIFDLAKEHKLKITDTGWNVPLENPRGAVKDFKKSTLDDLACFSKTIERLDTDIDGMRLRANAWSIGDVPRMRELRYPDQVEACRAALTNSSWMKSIKGGDDVEGRARANWLAHAERALAANKSTFALLPVARAMNAGGYLDDLKAKGYTVEQPE